MANQPCAPSELAITEILLHDGGPVHQRLEKKVLKGFRASHACFISLHCFGPTMYREGFHIIWQVSHNYIGPLRNNSLVQAKLQRIMGFNVFERSVPEGKNRRVMEWGSVSS